MIFFPPSPIFHPPPPPPPVGPRPIYSPVMVLVQQASAGPLTSVPKPDPDPICRIGMFLGLLDPSVIKPK